jgi:hypothetical protein
MKLGSGLGLGLAMLMLMAVPAVAAAPGVDITGTWALAADVQGVSVTETCTLTQSPEGKLTGSCDVNGMAKYATTGSVTDKTVIITHAGEYQGQGLTMTYTGKVNSDGGITGVLDVDPMSVSGSFSATKAAAPAK